MKQRLLLILLISLSSLIAWAPGTVAAKGGLTIVPSVKNIEFNQTQHSSVFDITLINNSVLPLDIRVKVMDFNAQNNQGGVTFVDASENYKYGLSKFMGFQPDKLHIDAGKKQAVTITITNPASLAAGGHYGAVLFELTGTTSRNQIAVQQTLASLIFAVKKGGEYADLRVNELVLSHSWLQPPKTVNLTIANNGNVHAAPAGKLELKDPFGRLIDQVSLNDNNGQVLPETLRQFALGLQTKKTLWPGFYQVSVITNAGNQQQRLFVLPAIFIVAVVVGGVVASGAFLAHRKYRQKR